MEGRGNAPALFILSTIMVNVIKYFLSKGGDSMTKTIEAIYENGVLRPVIPIKGLKKNERVAITVKKAQKTKHPLAGLCGILPDADAAEMLKTVKEEFEKVDINAW